MTNILRFLVEPRQCWTFLECPSEEQGLLLVSSLFVRRTVTLGEISEIHFFHLFRYFGFSIYFGWIRRVWPTRRKTPFSRIFVSFQALRRDEGDSLLLLRFCANKFWAKIFEEPLRRRSFFIWFQHLNSQNPLVPRAWTYWNYFCGFLVVVLVCVQLWSRPPRGRILDDSEAISSNGSIHFLKRNAIVWNFGFFSSSRTEEPPTLTFLSINQSISIKTINNFFDFSMNCSIGGPILSDSCFVLFTLFFLFGVLRFCFVCSILHCRRDQLGKNGDGGSWLSRFPRSKAINSV